MGKSIFVTVGTTLFEKLIAATTTRVALQWMQSNAYSRLVIQYGKGTFPSLPKDAANFVSDIEMYTFKPTLHQDMVDADLIISHAGAGTVHEAAKLRKQLVVVINTELIDNHQTELAHAMGERRHLFVVESPKEMAKMEMWDRFQNFAPEPYSGGDDQDFPRIIDTLVGFSR